MKQNCPYCWQEYQHCQCGKNRGKPQTAIWECPKCGKTSCDCGKEKSQWYQEGGTRTPTWRRDCGALSLIIHEAILPRDFTRRKFYVYRNDPGDPFSYGTLLASGYANGNDAAKEAAEEEMKKWQN